MIRTGVFFALMVLWLPTGRCEETFPASASVAVGQDVMIRFAQSSTNMTECSVRSPAPDLVTHILWGPGAAVGERIQYWGDGTTCGARIQNVSTSDIGQWILNLVRLTEVNETHETRALFDLHVINVNVSGQLSHDVTAGSGLNLTVGGTGNEYCDMRRPTGESPTLTFTGACQMTLNRATGADSGKWSALVGVAGKTEEVRVEGNVNVYEVIPVVGFSNSLVVPGGINLFCNFPHHNSLHFCRFVRPDGAGYRMVEGIGNAHYGYYGSGLTVGECGLTIERPQEVDYGTWKCMVSVSTGNSGGLTTMESSILISKEDQNALEDGSATSESQTTVLLGSDAIVQCTAAAALQYCTMVSPSGEQHTGMAALLSLGACALTLTNVSEVRHQGAWQCHMGFVRGGFEIQALLHVRVSESPLVASSEQVEAVLGQKAVLSCHTLAFLENASLPDAMKSPAIKYCRFIRPDGVGFAVRPDEDPEGRYHYHGAGFGRGECGLEITSVGVEDRGIWTCAVELDTVDNVLEEFSDSVLLSASGSGVVFPSWVFVNQGDDVILEMTHAQADQSHCSVRFPDGTVVDLGSQTHPVVSYWGAGIKQDSCGVRINTQLVNVSRGGDDEWTLTSRDGQGNQKEGSSWVVVTNSPSERVRETSTVVAELGGTLDVNCSHGQQHGGAYCIVLPPRSEPLHYVPGPCSTHVDPVTQAHFGEWTCITGKPDSMIETVEHINVITNELPLIAQWRPIDKSTGEIICKLSQTVSVDFCRFVSPDGRGLRATDGLARDRYSYTGQGLETGDCGLRISNISPADYGSWRCYVGFGEDIRIGYVTVVKAKDAGQREGVANERVVAVLGSRLTIACRANANLAYCWVRHPNGTTFTPSPGSACPSDAASCYEGAGLDRGECGLTVARAHGEDSGRWTCHMGVVNGGELVTTVEAQISATSLMAKVSEQEAFKGSSVTLKCISVPPGSALDYCRFVRSDGVGFHPAPQTQVGVYSYAGSGLPDGECGLLIKGVKSEDEGVWTCAGRLTGQTEEAQDTLALSVQVLSSASIGGIAVGCTLAVVLVIVAVVWQVKRTRQHRVSNASSTSSNESAEDTVLQVIHRPTYGTDESSPAIAIVSSEML